VNVHVRLFAALRERAGTGTLELELAEGAIVGDVWPHLGLGDEPSGLLYARNKAYVDRSENLAAGDDRIAVTLRSKLGHPLDVLLRFDVPLRRQPLHGGHHVPVGCAAPHGPIARSRVGS